MKAFSLVRDVAQNQVWDQIWRQVSDQVPNQIWSSIRVQVWGRFHATSLMSDQMSGNVFDEILGYIFREYVKK